jgi:hypothetical protein
MTNLGNMVDAVTGASSGPASMQAFASDGAA